MFESVSRLALAVQCGLLLDELQYQAGRYASIEVLQSAQTLGLVFSQKLVQGAARSGLVNKLQWLVQQRHTGTALQHAVAADAASSGSVEMIQWLRSQYVYFTNQALRIAAVGNHLPLAQYLRSIDTPWHADMAVQVAEKGHLDMLKWLSCQECPMNHSSVAVSAARWGHLHILKWLTIEHGVNLVNSKALAEAARGGHVPVMNWLIAQ